MAPSRVRWLAAAAALCQLTAALAGSRRDSAGGPAAFAGESDGVRCYCNTAECVTTGYMCRAPPGGGGGGGCYSDLTQQPRRHDGRYGCLNHLADTAEEAMRRCQNAPDKHADVPKDAPPPVSARVQRQDSLLLCCFQDLCNHEDSPLARRRLNLTASGLTRLAGQAGADAEGERPGYDSGEVWFKAATIAVPVCGALILFILVGVAVRMLKADAADLKLRGPPYMSHPLAQHPDADVKKVFVGCGASAPLLAAPGGRLLRVERAELTEPTRTKPSFYPPDCDIQR